jgi:hypothetical protein
VIVQSQGPQPEVLDTSFTLHYFTCSTQQRVKQALLQATYAWPVITLVFFITFVCISMFNMLNASLRSHCDLHCPVTAVQAPSLHVTVGQRGVPTKPLRHVAVHVLPWPMFLHSDGQPTMLSTLIYGRLTHVVRKHTTQTRIHPFKGSAAWQICLYAFYCKYHRR